MSGGGYWGTQVYVDRREQAPLPTARGPRRPAPMHLRQVLGTHRGGVRMTEQLAIAELRPLPVTWDGRPVEWGPWQENGRIFICDRTKRKHGLSVPSCSACGSTRPALHAIGLRHPIAIDTVPGEYLRTHRNGKPVHAQDPMPAYRDLHAERCQDCSHDTVYDMRTDESWDLDETDYGPEGSVAP